MKTITAAVIHKLVKDQHKQSTIQERANVLPLTEPVRKLVADITDLYGEKANKAYGTFDPDETTYPSAGILRRVFEDKSLSFIEGTKKLLRVLASRADQAALSKGGYVLMAHGKSDSGSDWFLVALINNVDSAAVNDESLEIIKTVHVDLENLRVAGRVDLSKWINTEAPDRYVGFLKHRGDVADYFKHFLGCQVVVKDTEETKRLVEGLRTFAKGEGMPLDQEETFLRTAHDYCRTRGKAREPLSLEELTNAAWPSNPKKLQMVLAATGIEVADGFVPDARSLRSLVKFHAKTKYWSVDLDRFALINGDAKYIKARGELVLRNLPADLKADLDQEVADDD